MVSVIDLSVSIPYVGEEFVRFDVGVTDNVVPEGANVLIVDGVENKVSKSGNGGLEFHIIILLER